jgi:hypothetical protein
MTDATDSTCVPARFQKYSELHYARVNSAHHIERGSRMRSKLLSVALATGALVITAGVRDT